MFRLLVLCFTLVNSQDDEFLYGQFPDGFKWGASTAAYQIEGAWDVDGKGENLWDYMSHKGYIKNKDTGDIAADSYRRYMRDIEMLKELKVTSYRFSLSWTRILPDGSTKKINQKGIDYYNKVINELLKANIEPLATIFHFDTPMSFMVNGGWNNESIVEYYKNYSRICFQKFGDRVKTWFTINEPAVVAAMPISPGESGKVYMRTRNLILAHAAAYRIYEKEFKATQKGKVAIVLNAGWMEPKNPNKPDDVTAATRAMEFNLGLFANPIYKNGDFPEIVKQRVASRSSGASRLPPFSEEEKKIISGSSDFFGLNFYSSLLTSSNFSSDKEDYKSDTAVNQEADPSWPGSAIDWLKVTPFGMRKILNWITKQYNNVTIMVTENGYCDSDGKLDDKERVDYLRSYINEMLKAMKLDGCDVIGYSVWTLMDNFEWIHGYSLKFGLYHVDFTDPKRQRTPKASSRYYRKLIEDNGFLRDGGSTTGPTGGGNNNHASVTIIVVNIYITLLLYIKR